MKREEFRAVTAQLPLLVRDSRDSDVAAITQIYGHWVREGFGTFELDPPAESEISGRRQSILGANYPHLVAEISGEVAGYAYASPYRPRPGYRFSCEDSIYVAPHVARHGVGRALLGELISRCEAMRLRLMIAVIGDSENAPSIGLHERLSFMRSGLLPAVGWKHGRWVDTVFMTRVLGAGASIPPTEK